ncbi:MAG: hypothetical protein KME10_17795 [Plectolyngbya sp. WJT66-NPBG17]|jgi:hypothetical protein|nr:hypothetical protein [Plectolyngbya sp. WJT66-NPBG17]MBW4525533.1 hypothetical protein [Phormidium tanganyikae FI6-MK23]
MRRTVRFFLYSTIAIFVVFVNALMIQLMLHAPMPLGGRVAGVQIRSLFIPGQAISCTQIGQQDQCQISLLGRPLELTLTSRSQEVKQCQLSYAGQTADCKGEFHALIIGGWMPVLKTESNLGLIAEQIENLREQYPQRNFFLHIVGEARLLMLATGIAIAAGMLTFLFGWLNFSKAMPYFVAGLIVSGVTWAISNVIIWGLGYVD